MSVGRGSQASGPLGAGVEQAGPSRVPGFGLLLYAFPRPFRAALGADLQQLCAEMHRSAYADRQLRLWWDLLRAGLGARLDELADRLGFGGSRSSMPPIPRSKASPMDSLIKDLMYAARMLRRNPGFTLVAVLSLALGIGANTAIFTVVNAALLQQLPVPDPVRLVALHWIAPRVEMPDFSISGWMLRNAEGRSESSSFSVPFFRAVREADTALESVFGFADLNQVNLRFEGDSELTGGQVVTGDYYSGLGVAPHLGRLIDPADDEPGAEPVAVLTHGYWQRRFAGDPAVLGEIVHVNDQPFTIVGVSPPGFAGALQVGSSPDVTMPVAWQGSVMRWDNLLERGDFWWLHIMGRLADGATREQALASTEPLYRGAVLADLDGATEETVPDLAVVSGAQGMTERRTRMVEPLMTLASVIGLVLLIACANLANLLLARSSSRQREIAVRLSLGASRVRLVRQLLTESVVLALLGGLLGLGVAVWLCGLLVGLADLGELSLEFGMDLRVLGFTFAVAVATGILFGLAPALRASRVDLTPALKQESSSPVGTRRGMLLSKSLMTVQVGMSLLLLVVAGLFVRTLQNLQASERGYNPENVLVFSVDPSLNRYEAEQRSGFFTEALQELRRIPGVMEATVASHPPMSGFVTSYNVHFADEAGEQEESNGAFVNIIGPDFLETFRIDLVHGRALTAEDTEGAPMVAVVNEAFARSYFPDRNPVGRRFGFDEESRHEYEIVGVIGDVAYQDLRDNNRPEAVHLAYAQHAGSLRRMTFAARVRADPMAIAPRAREVVKRLDANLPVFRVRSQEAQRDSTLAQERHFARMSSLLGGLALVLACIGLYGILSYSMLRRRREIGVRMALGAGRADVLRLVARELVPVGAGVVLGLGAAWATTRWLESFLYDLAPLDPTSLVAATLLLAAVAGVAAWLPARRASAIDPVIALRSE